MARMGLSLLFGLLAISLAAGQRNVTLLYSDILDLLRENSDPDVAPISKDDPKPVEIRLEVDLLYIGKIDMESDTIEIVIQQRTMWKNPALTWNENSPDYKFGNVTVPLRYLWPADIVVSNALNSPDIVSPELAVVSSDGEVMYEPLVLLRLHTDLSGLHTPSGANITLKFESFSYDKSQLTLATPTTTCFTVDDFVSRKFLAINPTVSTHIQQSTTRRFDVHTYSFILKKK